MWIQYKTSDLIMNLKMNKIDFKVYINKGIVKCQFKKQNRMLFLICKYSSKSINYNP